MVVYGDVVYTSVLRDIGGPQMWDWRRVLIDQIPSCRIVAPFPENAGGRVPTKRLRYFGSSKHLGAFRYQRPKPEPRWHDFIMRGILTKADLARAPDKLKIHLGGMIGQASPLWL
jgi:hypothetical protein